MQVEDVLKRLDACRRQHAGRQQLGVSADALDGDKIAGPEIPEPSFVECSHLTSPGFCICSPRERQSGGLVNLLCRGMVRPLLAFI